MNERKAMKKRDIPSEEEVIRILMQGVKMKAPERIKHRVMHQLEAEKAVAPRVKKEGDESGSVLRDLVTIFGTMYALLAAMVVVVYIPFGGQFLLSTEFVGVALLVVFVFSMLWLIAQLDRRMQAKRFWKKKTSI
ncbi:MAG: hypothetical protein ACOX19_12805 [Fermentimonas sp.]|jgi:hypothetical protein